MDITGMNAIDRGHLMQETLLHHFGKTSEILIFLIGAMTIVEIIDHFHGFSAIKGFIRTNKKRTLLWIVALDRKSTRLNSSHVRISYAVFCLKKKWSRP